MMSRVDDLIERVMAACPLYSASASAKYYEDVHQELAPLARQLEAELNAANKLIEDSKADTQRLDFLQSMTKGYGIGWVLRDSTSGRGMRLHETSGDGYHDPRTRDSIKATVRDAIDAAIVIQARH